MTNHEAILAMDIDKLGVFLNHIYLTGVNNGVFAMSHEEEDLAKLTENPYGSEWLKSEADDATTIVYDESGELYLPDELVQSILRNAQGDDNR